MDLFSESMEFKVIFVAFWPLQNLKCLFSRPRPEIAMASAGSNCPLDVLLGEGSNSENNPVNPEICYNDDFAAQEEEDRRMAEFG